MTPRAGQATGTNAVSKLFSSKPTITSPPFCFGGQLVSATKGTIPTEGIFRFSVAHFLIGLFVLLGTVPFVDEFAGGLLIESVLITLVLLSAVVAVGGRRRSLVVGILLATPAV